MLYDTEKALRSESKINNFLFYFDSTSIMLSLNTSIAPHRSHHKLYGFFYFLSTTILLTLHSENGFIILQRSMEVICLEDAAFYALVEKVVERIKEKNNIKQDKWISGKEAMTRLRIKSVTTMQRLRDTGAIRYSQPEKKIILYDAE